jgi:hypothetical protein
VIARPTEPSVIPSLIMVVELRPQRRTSPTTTELSEARVLLNARLTGLRAQDPQLRCVPMAALLGIPTTKAGIWVTHAGELRPVHQGKVVPVRDSCYFRQLRRGTTSFLFGDQSCLLWDAGPRAERFPTEALTAEVSNQVSRIKYTICGNRGQRWDVWTDVVTGALFTVFFHASSQCFELQVKKGEVFVVDPNRAGCATLTRGQALLGDVASGATKVTAPPGTNPAPAVDGSNHRETHATSGEFDSALAAMLD